MTVGGRREKPAVEIIARERQIDSLGVFTWIKEPEFKPRVGKKLLSRLEQAEEVV